MTFLRYSLTALVLVLLTTTPAEAQTEYWYDQDPLPRGMTAEEELRRHEIGAGFRATAPPEGAVRNIAEFERNEAVMIRYPLGIPLALVSSLSEHTRVITLVASQTQQNQAASVFAGAGVNMENIEFLQAPTNSMWTRDYGPFYVVDENHQVSIVDFIYNRPRPSDNAIPAALGAHLDIPVYAMNIVHTGGNYMSDAWGTGASTDLIWEENNYNQTLVLETMDAYMGIHTYHVTIDPQDDYIKHIDTWGKFLDVDKVLIAEVPPSDPRYDDYEEVANYFASQISAYGTPYQVYRVYTPQGQPYANSLILNERVYVPIVGSQWDQAALAVFQEAMPGYEVLGFTGSWASTDALHCRVKEVADRGMLHLAHIPVQGEHPYQPEFELEVDIIPYSGADLIDDELYLIYRSGTLPFDTLALAHVDGATFKASIPIGDDDTEITYYFSAADASGRSETWPLIGAPGARTFTVDHDAVSTEPGARPQMVTLQAAYPNPASGPVKITYALGAQLDVRLEVFNVLGQRVAIVVDGVQPAGTYEASFDTQHLAGGVYFYRLSAGEHVATGRVTVSR